MALEGIEQALILPFTTDVAWLTPEQFARQIVGRRSWVRAPFWVGDNFRFGHDHAGNVETLRQLGELLGVRNRDRARRHPPRPAGEQQRDSRPAGIGEGGAGGALVGAAVYARRRGLRRAAASAPARPRPTLNLSTAAELIPRTGVRRPRSRSFGKPVWANEDGPWNGNWAAAAGQCGGLAQAYNRNYVLGKMSKTIVWSPVTSYYDILPLPGSGLMRANQPWSGHYDVQPAVWITAHTTQFIEPGWKYLGGSACGMLPGGGSHVAAVSADGKSLSVVIETIGAKQTQALSLKLAGGLAAGQLHCWRSTAREQFVRLADLAVVDGTCSLEAEAEAIYSLTTTDGQQKAVTEIPPSLPLPLPYRDDFDSYRVNATPKYLCDCFGAFEVKAGGRRRGGVGGNCLRQIIMQRGIEWCGDGDPLTIIGSPAWRDYEVACDVCFDFKQAAWLYGRIQSVPEGKKPPPQGYGLRVAGDGAWNLVENRSGGKLAGGKVEIAPGSWHRLALRMLGKRLTVLIDGKEAGSAVSDTFRSGLAGLGCGWEEVKFDNLAIEGENPISPE